MFYRLYDTKNKVYIKANETMAYSVHPSGAVLCDGVEMPYIVKELSTGLEDKNGKEIYEGDLIEDHVVVIEPLGVGLRGINGMWQGQLHHRSSELEVMGTVHDEEMEAE